MRADPFAQLKLLDVQELDSRLDALRHQAANLPETAELRRLSAQMAELRATEGALRTEVEDLTREQRRADADVEQVKARRVRDQQRLDSGVIGNPKDLERLQHELVSLDRRVTELEDAELEVMERAEAAQATLDGLTSQRATHLAARAEAEQAAATATVEIDAEVETTAAERAELAATMPADLLALYEKIRAAEGGVGAGEIARGRGGGCRLDLMNNEKAEYRAAPPDEVLRHEECGRILVRTAESGL